MKFYQFQQNNSGGYFIENEDVSIYVLIESQTSDDANTIARKIGIYFNGCDSGRDCRCCGDRWRPVDQYGGITFPYRYTQYFIFTCIEKYATFLSDENLCFGTKISVRIHYYNGTIKSI